MSIELKDEAAMSEPTLEMKLMALSDFCLAMGVSGQDIEPIKAAIAEITRLRERTEWRPIETAPKDGTEILVASHDCVDQAIWGRTKYHGEGWLDFEVQCNVTSYTSKPIDGVTHWLPLHPPPGDKT